jgi:hypothetical protein
MKPEVDSITDFLQQFLDKKELLKSAFNRRNGNEIYDYLSFYTPEVIRTAISVEEIFTKLIDQIVFNDYN